jgi:hypothetical protein
MHRFYPSSLLQLLILSATLGSVTARADYVQTNLVSDIPGFASITDPSLKNPWGVSHSATSPFWISDQGTNVSTLYNVAGGTVSKNALTAAIPTTVSGPQGPTGQVNNNIASSFVVGLHRQVSSLRISMGRFQPGTVAPVRVR